MRARRSSRIAAIAVAGALAGRPAGSRTSVRRLPASPAARRGRTCRTAGRRRAGSRPSGRAPRSAASARSRARGRGRRSCSRPAASRSGPGRAARRCRAPSRSARPPSWRRRRSGPGPARTRVVEGAQRLLDRRRRIEAVDLVEVDVVELQPLQARLRPPSMMWPRDAPRSFGPAPVSPNTLVATTTSSRGTEVPERLADDLLRTAAGVDVGGVDEVDAGVERAADERFDLAPAAARRSCSQMPSPPPKVMVPRQSSETNRPVRPSGLYFIASRVREIGRAAYAAVADAA